MQRPTKAEYPHRVEYPSLREGAGLCLFYVLVLIRLSREPLVEANRPFQDFQSSF